MEITPDPACSNLQQLTLGGLLDEVNYNQKVTRMLQCYRGRSERDNKVRCYRVIRNAHCIEMSTFTRIQFHQYLEEDFAKLEIPKQLKSQNLISAALPAIAPCATKTRDISTYHLVPKHGLTRKVIQASFRALYRGMYHDR